MWKVRTSDCRAVETQLLGLDAGWEARRAGTKGPEDHLPEIYVGELLPVSERSAQPWKVPEKAVFSASDEALLAALSLWYPGVMQNNQNVSRLISGNQGFCSKQIRLKDKYLLALSGLI